MDYFRKKEDEMGFFKSLMQEAANGMNINDIPFFFLRLFVAGIFAYLFFKSLPQEQQKGLAAYAIPIAMVFALFAIIVRHEIAIAIIGLSAVSLAKLPGEISLKQWAALLLSTLFGSICGFGFILHAVFAFIVIYPFYFIATRK